MEEIRSLTSRHINSFETDLEKVDAIGDLLSVGLDVAEATGELFMEAWAILSETEPWKALSQHFTMLSISIHSKISNMNTIRSQFHQFQNLSQL